MARLLLPRYGPITSHAAVSHGYLLRTSCTRPGGTPPLGLEVWQVRLATNKPRTMASCLSRSLPSKPMAGKPLRSRLPVSAPAKYYTADRTDALCQAPLTTAISNSTRRG
ncbi:uncharacterized protein LOC144100528 [Amblyomma americanum]